MKILNFKKFGLYLALVMVLVFSSGCFDSLSLSDILRSDILSFGKLKGDNLAAYELITEVSYMFKNPSSVRLISGTVSYDEKDEEYSGWFAIIEENEFGATTVGHYRVGYHSDGKIFALDLEKYGSSSSMASAKKKEELDVDKINKEIDKYWDK